MRRPTKEERRENLRRERPWIPLYGVAGGLGAGLSELFGWPSFLIIAAAVGAVGIVRLVWLRRKQR